MDSLRLAGRPGEARTRYAAAVARLRSELEVEPGPELRLAGSASRARGRGHDARSPSGGQRRSSPPDLVGRGPALAELAAAWASSRSGQLTAVVIEGERTGIGKTRLTEEFLRTLGTGGAGVITLPLPSGGRETAAQVAKSVFAGLASAPGLGAASPAALATMVALLPRLGGALPCFGQFRGRALARGRGGGHPHRGGRGSAGHPVRG